MGEGPSAGRKNFFAQTGNFELKLQGKILLLAGILFFFAPLLCSADLYQWQDEQGGWHVNDRMEKIPEPYRTTARHIETRDRTSTEPEKSPLHSRREAPREHEVYSTEKGSSFPISPVNRYEIPYKQRQQSIEVDVRINDHSPRTMILDTGASYTTLSRKTAEALGISLKGVLPRTWISTANGTITAYFVRLASVQIGQARVENLTAIIPVQSRLGVPGLLGLNFLNEFDWSNDTMNNRLTLKEISNVPGEETYGGHGKKWWRKKFSALKERIRDEEALLTRMEAYDTRGPMEQNYVDRQTRIQEKNVAFFRKELELLDSKASRYMVPRGWR